jgi:LysM repeat protein
MIRIRPLLLTLFSGLLMSVVAIVSAQGTCPALVEQALNELGDNCGGMDNNSACYGYNRLMATFVEDVAPDYFTQVTDRTDLTLVQSIQTSALNLQDDEWGIAVMKVTANIPNTLPGQAVTFLLLGDAQIQNQVAPQDAFLPAEPVSVTTQSNVTLRENPTSSSTALASVAAGTVLQADAYNRDGVWLRVAWNDRPAWVQSVNVNSPSELSALPNATSTSRSPMQAFYFSTGTGSPACNEAPNTVTVRSPETLSVDLTVNGIDVRIGSTINFQQTGVDKIAVSVAEGGLQLFDGQVVAEGETLDATLDNERRIISLDNIRPQTPDEQQLSIVTLYIMDIATGEETGDDTEDVCANAGGEATYRVQAGDTLFSIGRAYNASLPAIIARNDINNPQAIIVGQQLIIPNPCSGFIGLPVPPTAPPPPPPTQAPPPTDTPVETEEVAPPSINFNASWTCAPRAPNQINVTYSGALDTDRVTFNFYINGSPYTPPPQPLSGASGTFSVNPGFSGPLTNGVVATTSNAAVYLPDIPNGC